MNSASILSIRNSNVNSLVVGGPDVSLVRRQDGTWLYPSVSQCDNNSDSCLSSLSPHNDQGWSDSLPGRQWVGGRRGQVVSLSSPTWPSLAGLDNYAKLPSLFTTLRLRVI